MVGVRAKDHGEKRQLILDKSAELFGEQGFHGTTIVHISAACGASKAWLFHYFPNKEAILYTLLEEFLELFCARLDGCISEGDSPTERLRSYIASLIDILQEYRINYPVLFNEMKFLPEEDQRKLQEIERRQAQQLRDIILAINPNLAKRKEIVAPVTFLVFGALNWTYTWYDPKRKLSREKLIDLCARMMIGAILEA